MDAPKYRAFISYSHRDSRWASWLHTSLEKYRPPKPLIGTVTALGAVPKRIAPIFRDRERSKFWISELRQKEQRSILLTPSICARPGKFGH
jgi:hypothetical protein